MSGPITLYDVAGRAGAKGTTYFVWAMALVSINLGIINLLPIPVLDGGHLAFLVVETVRRRPLTRRTRGDSLERIIADLNPLLKGWFGYFKHACRWEFPPLDGLSRRRLRSLLRKQEKRPGAGRCHADHKRWPNAYFAAAGLFAMTEARQLASQSRC